MKAVLANTSMSFAAKQQRMAKMNSRLSFALGFIALRLIGWIPALVRYLRDLRDLAPDEPLVVGIMATTALIITGLQIFWGCKVVRGLADAILGRAALPPDEAAAEAPAPAARSARPAARSGARSARSWGAAAASAAAPRASSAATAPRTARSRNESPSARFAASARAAAAASAAPSTRAGSQKAARSAPSADASSASGGHARHAPDAAAAVSYTHLTLPTKA